MNPYRPGGLTLAGENPQVSRADVVLADIRMPHFDGLGVTRQLAGPGGADPLAVVVVTTFDLDEYEYTALRCGRGSRGATQAHISGWGRLFPLWNGPMSVPERPLLRRASPIAGRRGPDLS
jgi:CheY-like chemotaxis protein